MSYILEAIKKAEREREIIQYIEYTDKFSHQIPAWHRKSIIYIPIMVSIIMLLWPQVPLMPKKTYIIKPTIYQSMPLYRVYNYTPTTSMISSTNIYHRDEKLSFDKKRSRKLINYEN
jgi:hypothetical protein